MADIVDIRHSDVNPPVTDAFPPVYPSFKKPLDVARRIRADIFTMGELSTLGHWRKNWWLFNGKIWAIASADDISLTLWETLDTAKVDHNGELVDWGPTPPRVKSVQEPLRLISRFNENNEIPMWVDGLKHKTPAGSLIVLNNGWFNLEKKEFKPGHSPALFTTSNLPFNYAPGACCPRWDQFLSELFTHDPKGALALQEFAGYLISGRTDMQKALMLLGPSRSGKGIISKRLRQLVEVGNTISPTITSLGAEFGLSELVGKSFAVVEDMRQGNPRRVSDAVERLLNIVGEDAVSANRKGLNYWNGTLKTRIMLVSNEAPQLPDASGAVLKRFLPIKLQRSFAGQEDPTLNKDLEMEMPGIFNWALAGLQRLEQQGRFTEPQTMADVIAMMSDLSQPEKMFLDETNRYEISGNPDDWVAVKEIHAAYKAWCESSGRRHLSQERFCRAVDAADPHIDFKNSWVDGVKQRRLHGVKHSSVANFRNGV